MTVTFVNELGWSHTIVIGRPDSSILKSSESAEKTWKVPDGFKDVGFQNPEVVDIVTDAVIF